MNKKEDFIRGLKDGLPIGLGYFPVSISYGMTAVLLGVPIYQTIIISFTNLTSAGQFAGTKILVAGGSFVELILALIIIEIRYFLMSLSISQKLDPSVTMKQRFLIAYDVTDENFAMAIGINSFALVLGATGILPAIYSSVMHNMTTILVVGNSLKLLKYKLKN